MIELAHPWFLTLGALILLLPLMQRRSLADFTPVQQRVCFLLRALILLLLIGALAGPRWMLPSRELAVLFAVDDSASITPAAREQARAFVSGAIKESRSADTVGVIGFAKEAVLWQPPTAPFQLAAWPEMPERKATGLAEALDFASAVFPAGKTRRLVMLTDGNDTAGRAAETAARVASPGVEVFPVPMRNGTEKRRKTGIHHVEKS